MDNARIDENDKPTWLAYNETTGEVEPVAVDPDTGALLVLATPYSLQEPTAITTAKIDENENATLLAYNETTDTVECIRCTTDNEILLISI